MENITDTKDKIYIGQKDKEISSKHSSDKEKTQYFYLKSDKLSYAIYKITEFIPESEPLKYKLRDLSLSLVVLIADLDEFNKTKKIDVLEKVISVIKAIKSLLGISRGQMYLSEMNYSVLVREFSLLEHNIMSGVNDQLVDVSLAQLGTTTSLKRESGLSLPSTTETQGTEVFRHTESRSQLNQSRRRQIVEFLGTRGSSSIKDICTAVPNCSEKTVQRELSTLVTEGSVSRVGERRWSRYSLASVSEGE